MADWYVSSVAYTALPQWAASHAYTVGNIIRPLTAAAIQYATTFRCTTAGTSGTTEPTWTTPYTNNATITDGGAVWTNVSGQSAYNWTAPALNLYCLVGYGQSPRVAVGDRVFLSSDHVESLNTGNPYALVSGSQFGVVEVISVNRAGNVPPQAADALSGAVLENISSNLILDDQINQYWQGITFKCTGSGSGCNFMIGYLQIKQNYLKNCLIWFNNTTASSSVRANNGGKFVFDNTQLQFGAVGQSILGYQQSMEILWLNTAPALNASSSIPTTLITQAQYCPMNITCRGLDLTTLNTTLYAQGGNGPNNKILLDSCKIASGLTRYTPSASASDEIELVNCYDGTHILSERHTPAGDVTTEFSTTMVGGAQDDVGLYSHKLVSSTRCDPWAMTLDGFWLDVDNTNTGSARTATVEIISSASLNNTDITVKLQYEGTAGSSLASFVDSITNPLVTVAAIPTSTATWNSPPATPVAQHIQVTFTPQTNGRLRALVRLGKASTTVWVNPQVVVT